MRTFKSLTEQEILALAISLEEEDARIVYATRNALLHGYAYPHPKTSEVDG